MPKSPKKGGGKKGRPTGQNSSQIDFTLADFADAAQSSSAVKSGRMKKGAANALNTTVKELVGKSAETVDSVSWFEKDLDDFDLEPETAVDEDANESSEDDTKHTSHKVASNHAVSDTDQGLEYPLDIWFLIGDHVLPEAVGKFAVICRSSHLVVHTARFWSNLYKRFYTSDSELVTYLQPRYMQKVHGLRARVVRSLYYLYPPFLENQRHLTPFRTEPDFLEGATCLMMWYQQLKSHWHFYFKFRHSSLKKCSLAKKDHIKKGPLGQFFSDIDYNSEENCCVLLLITKNFIFLPVAMGQVLRKVCVSVGHAMRYHKVKLILTPTNVVKTKGDLGAVAGGSTLILDPVLDLRIHHWWDPRYPYNVTTGPA